MCLTGMIAPLMQVINNFTVTGLGTMLPVCIVTQILTNTMSSVAFTTIAAMALDRAVAVSWHMRYFEVMTPSKCGLFLLVQVSYWQCQEIGTRNALLFYQYTYYADFTLE